MKLREDPDRLALSLIDAMHALEMASERQCSLAVAALQIGKEWKPERQSRRHPQLVRTFWKKVIRPGAPRSLEGKAATLRSKRRSYIDPASKFWRRKMGAAFMVVFSAKDQETAKVRVLALAEQAGEGKLARDVLWRMIELNTASD
jgi:hypothetical protein